MKLSPVIFFFSVFLSVLPGFPPDPRGPLWCQMGILSFLW